MYRLLPVFSSALVAAAVLVLPALASADTVTANFENPPYSLGTINGQDGWSSTGAAGAGCAVYDHAVDSSFSTPGFGSQSLRISNAVVSGCFSDQTFSKSLVNAAGETIAENGGVSGGVRQPHFESTFTLASAVPGAQQPGLYMSVSPDRGDGARMSYLRFEDQADGIHVFFDDYQDGAVEAAGTCSTGDNFVETDIATLNRSVSHTIKFSMDFVDGPNNDIVQIYIDGTLKQTGTSWEGYFNYCEGNATRTVDSLLFRTGGTQGTDNAPATAGKGFLVDNMSLTSGPIPVIPPAKTGNLRVIKVTWGAKQGTFNFNGTGVLGAFSITANHYVGSKLFKSIPIGSYSLTETVPSGWTQVFNGCKNITVKENKTAWCIVINSKPRQGNDNDSHWFSWLKNH